MEQYKYLAKNIWLLTISNFVTRLLNFLLVPLYTNILTTAEYGTYDLFNSTIGFLLPILTLNIQDAVMRYSIDNSISRKAIVTVGTKLVFVGNLIFCLGLCINYIFEFNTLIQEYAVYFFLMFSSQTLSGLVLGYTRGIDRIKEFSISSVVCSIVAISSNILFLLVFKWGIRGYFLANIIGPFVQTAYLLIKVHIIKEISFTQKYKDETREMIAYSSPLIANSIAWWVNNASDKYVVTWFCGLAENGIYSVASKIPSILNIFQTIFGQAWTLSAVKDFDPEDKNGFFAHTYAVYNCLMTILCSALIVGDKILAKLLYANDFFVAWRYAPWLTIAIVFGALSGHIGGCFTAIKKSKMVMATTIVGAASNIFLNILLTPLMGPLGAAIATTVCYIITWALRLIESRKIIKLKINILRDIISYMILSIQSVALLIYEGYSLYIIQMLLFIIIFLLYINDVRSILARIIKFIKEKRNRRNN